MSDRLAKQVAERLRFLSDGTKPIPLCPDDLNALAALVEAGHNANSFAADYGEGEEWDEALRRVAESLGVTGG